MDRGLAAKARQKPVAAGCIGKRDKGGAELQGLLEKLVNVMAGRQRQDADPIFHFPNDLERVAPDRSGGT
jgi:hypothetical protein